MKYATVYRHWLRDVLLVTQMSSVTLAVYYLKYAISIISIINDTSLLLVLVLLLLLLLLLL